MSVPLLVNVRGIPGAQGSKRHVGGGRLIEMSRKVAPWRQDVKAATEAAITAAGWTPATGPVKVALHFHIARPRSHYRTGRHAHELRANAPHYVVSRGAGDLDKLVRSTSDALVAAGALADDSLIAVLFAWKTYAPPGPVPGALIVITPLDEGGTP